MSVDADISASVDLFGKSVSDLQSSITFGDTGVTGTLKYVTDYTGFSGDISLQSGNYIAFRSKTDNGATISVELVGGTSGETPLDDDGLAVFRISDKDTQKIKVNIVKGTERASKEFALTGLTLETEGDR